jgi:hypothetical protein
MIVAVTRPARPYADLSDLTSKTISERGWRVIDGDEVYLIQFAVNLTADEEAAIRRRLTTSGQVEEDLQARAASAYADLQAFEALSNPTNAQTLAAVKLLCRVARALIRLQLRQLDAAD